MNQLSLSFLKTMNVLIAEDDHIAAEFLKDTLEQYFKNIHIINDGQKALDFLQQFSIELLITDIAMPNASGIKLIETIRKQEIEENRQKLPIIVISARQEADELLALTRLHLVDYVIKPLSLIKILDALQRLCIEIRSKCSYLYSIGDNMSYNPFTKSLNIGDQPIMLTPSEVTLMELLLENRGRLLPKTVLMQKVYGYEVEDVTFRNLLARFRKKIGKDKLISIKDLGLRLA